MLKVLQSLWNQEGWHVRCCFLSKASSVIAKSSSADGWAGVSIVCVCVCVCVCLILFM